MVEAVGEVNSCLENEDSPTLLQALHNEHAGLINVQDSNALHYLTVLRAMRAAKVEVYTCIRSRVEVKHKTPIQ